MSGVFEGLQLVFGIIFATMLVIKYFKGRTLNRTAATLLVSGFGAIVVGGFLAFIIGMASRRAAVIIVGLFMTASGVMLTIGLFIELLGGIPGTGGGRGVSSSDQDAFSPAAPQAPLASPPQSSPAAPSAPVTPAGGTTPPAGGITPPPRPGS